MFLPSGREMIPINKAHMWKQMFRRHDSNMIERDLTRAKSLLIALRAKIDNGSDRKVQAYGKALRHIADLLSESLRIPASDALLARGIRINDLDYAFGDLQRSAARCRTYLNEPSPTAEIAESLAAACSILAELYRMRFHMLDAAEPHRAAAADQATRLAELIELLVRPDLQGMQIRGDKPVAA